MVRQVRTAILFVLMFTAVLGLAYPLAVTAVSQVAFADKANGSLIKRDGKVIGSSLIGQSFTAANYFHSRPSVAGDGYDATASAASSLGAVNENLKATVAERATAYRVENQLSESVDLPSDAVNASASGLDPHISVANALLQSARVATERGLTLDAVRVLIDEHTTSRALGFLGDPAVHVLELNLALDELKDAPN